MLRKIDIFQTKLTFDVEENDSIKTNFGGFITILMVVFFGLLVAGFGQDFFKRENPNILRSESFYFESPYHAINNKNFTFSFFIQDSNNMLIDDDTFAYFTFSYRHFRGSEFVSSEGLEVTPCTQDLLVEGHFDKEFNYTKMYCPRFNNITIGGGWIQPEIKFIFVNALFCPEGEFSPSGRPCKSEVEKRQIISQNLFLEMNYQKIFFEPDDYEHPMKQVKGYFHNLIDLELMKRTEFKIREITTETDFGWLIKDVKEDVMLGVDTIGFESISRETRKESIYFAENCFATLAFTMQNEKIHYKREYQKVQTLVAQVGGILKAFLVAGFFVVNNYNTYSFMLRMKDSLESINKHFSKVSKTNDVQQQEGKLQLHNSNMIVNFDDKSKYEIVGSNINDNQSQSIAMSKISVQYDKLDKTKGSLILNENLERNKKKFDLQQNSDENGHKCLSEEEIKTVKDLSQSKPLVNFLNRMSENLHSPKVYDISALPSQKLLDHEGHSNSFFQTLKYLFYKLVIVFNCCCSDETKKGYRWLSKEYSRNMDIERYVKNMIFIEQTKDFLFEKI